jgi:hypothetical protein
LHVSLERYLPIRKVNTQPTPLLCQVVTTNKQTNLEAMAFEETTVNAIYKNPALVKTNNTYYEIISEKQKEYMCATYLCVCGENQHIMLYKNGPFQGQFSVKHQNPQLTVRSRLT